MATKVVKVFDGIPGPSQLGVDTDDGGTVADLDTAQTFSTKTLSACIDADVKRCTGDVTFTSNTTLANVTGLTGFSLLAAGVYEFEVELQTNCSTNGGISVAFKYTTLTLTSIQLVSETFAASSLATARNTTTTDATKFIDNKTAAWIHIRLKGTLVVNAAGTLAVQAAQNTSHADTTTVYAGSTARFTRLS